MGDRGAEVHGAGGEQQADQGACGQALASSYTLERGNGTWNVARNLRRHAASFQSMAESKPTIEQQFLSSASICGEATRLSFVPRCQDAARDVAATLQVNNPTIAVHGFEPSIQARGCGGVVGWAKTPGCVVELVRQALRRARRKRVLFFEVPWFGGTSPPVAIADVADVFFALR